MSEINLLPCPFCGGEASRRKTDDHSRGQEKLHIECDVCNARTDWQYSRAKNLVDEWWNARHEGVANKVKLEIAEEIEGYACLVTGDMQELFHTIDNMTKRLRKEAVENHD